MLNGLDGTMSIERKPNATSVFTGYDRAKRVVPTLDRCDLEHIGCCHGELQRAHLDGNPLNNDRANIKVLCDSHHGLYDNEKIDLNNPVMPDFFISGGKRRYRPRLKARICKRESCRKPFTSESAPQRYCSDECSAIAKQETHRAARSRYEEKQKNAGTTWTAPCR